MLSATTLLKHNQKLTEKDLAIDIRVILLMRGIR